MALNWPKVALAAALSLVALTAAWRLGYEAGLSACPLAARHRELADRRAAIITLLALRADRACPSVDDLAPLRDEPWPDDGLPPPWRG